MRQEDRKGSYNPETYKRIAVAAALVTVGVCLMHYGGMVLAGAGPWPGAECACCSRRPMAA